MSATVHELRGRLSDLWIAYQPIVACASREVVGYETLLRSPASHDACPSALFRSARRGSWVEHLGRTIRARIADSMERVPADCTVFVNLEHEDLSCDALLDGDEPLSAHASRVVLELTERGELGDIAELDERLRRLRRLGYRICLDDVGAGHNGLATLAEVDVDIAKVDRSIVSGIDMSRPKQRILGFLRDFCRERDVVCLGEGVEREAEHRVLAARGIDLAQGYLYGRPGALSPSRAPLRGAG